MKVLAFTDIHGSSKAIEKLRMLSKRKDVDALACAGDITIFDNNLDVILHELDSFGKPVYMIHGNHEFEDVFYAMCKHFKNIIPVHEAVYIDAKHKIAFLGYGGGGFSLVDRRFEIVTNKLKKKIPKDHKIFLITHAPPYGTKVDKIMDQHCGNKSITNFIKKTPSVIIAISGHLHECEGQQDRIGKAKVLNPGPFGKILSISV
ncbi:hypothetical protein COV93_04460 [Candidatus Woesearchaeota archaeon CG11_big_fil_rev_8_21_14_0_20_43_8]|nr:MAG: hypothetical protein COV93_04460 [Candidatus Woesearchaeota archaeon CG11_big_fil_rev_8_21_14_0_20_43_8]